MVLIWTSGQQSTAGSAMQSPVATTAAPAIKSAAAPAKSCLSASAPSLKASAAAATTPISARQRKQVYMHSAVFDTAGAPPHSVYTASRQSAVLGEVRQQYLPQRGPAAVAMPSAADLKATEIVGHGVITWDSKVPTGRRSADDKFVQFADGGDHIRVVHANRDRELRSSHCSTLEWNDIRCEMTRADTRSQAARGDLGAVQRKSFNLSSEVLGNERRMERSTRSASKEIRPLHLTNVYGVDSALDGQVDNSLGASAGRVPLSARERKEQSLDASKASQFSAGTKAFASPRNSPRSPKGASPTAPGPETEAVERRRSERNYSDLFGSASPMTKHVVRRAAGEAASPFGNVGACSPRGGQVQEETLVYRPHSSALMRTPKTADPEEQVLPMTPRMRRVEPDQKVQKTFAEERACWDTKSKGGMDSSLELSRRRRDRMLQRDAPGQEEDRARSASQRKRMELGSRGLRCGMGAAPARYEDSDAASTPGGKRSYSTSHSPIGGSFRSLPRAPHSARARKLSSLQSAVIF